MTHILTPATITNRVEPYPERWTYEELVSRVGREGAEATTRSEWAMRDAIMWRLL